MTLKRNLTLRIALAAVIVGMLAWLAVSSSPQDERFATSRQLIRSGEIGHVADADAALFQTLVQEAVAIAGISGDPIVNGEPVKGKLHFYLTDPKAAGFAHCVEGNAVYDADLDSIFVDRSLFNPAELGKVGQALHWERWAPKRFAFTYTFTMLIVLHELGHRQLHRFQRGMFDTAVNADGRRRENEADRFAATVLRQARTPTANLARQCSIQIVPSLQSSNSSRSRRTRWISAFALLRMAS